MNKMTIVTKTVMTGTVITFAALSISFLASLLSAQSTPTPQTADPYAELRDRYAQLSQEIYATHLEPGSGKYFQDKPRLAEVRSELRRLIEGQIRAALSAPNPSAQQIASAISSIQGPEHALSPASGNTPWADFFSLGDVRQIAVAYNTLEGGDGIPNTHAYLEFFRAVGGGWDFAAQSPTEQDFQGASFDVQQMDSGVPGEAWFIAWGTRFGDDAGRLRVRLYGYDGTAVRTIWKRDELIGGGITVARHAVTLSYDKVYMGGPNSRVSETFRITPFGLE